MKTIIILLSTIMLSGCTGKQFLITVYSTTNVYTYNCDTFEYNEKENTMYFYNIDWLGLSQFVSMVKITNEITRIEKVRVK